MSVWCGVGAITVHTKLDVQFGVELFLFGVDILGLEC